MLKGAWNRPSVGEALNAPWCSGVHALPADGVSSDLTL